MGTTDSFPGDKAVEVKNAWSYNSTPPIRLHDVVLRWKKSTGRTLLDLFHFMLCINRHVTRLIQLHYLTKNVIHIPFSIWVLKLVLSRSHISNRQNSACQNIFMGTSQTLLSASFDALTAVNIQVRVFWIATPCSVMVGYKHFRGPCCPRLQSSGFWRLVVMWKDTNVSKVHATTIFNVKLVLYQNTTRCQFRRPRLGFT